MLFLLAVGLPFVCLVYIGLSKYLSKFEIKDLPNRNVFITGCDTGFGNILARKLDAKGVVVYAGCLTEKGASDLHEVTSTRLTTVQIDVTEKESVRKAFGTVKGIVGKEGLWGVVNNAGILPNYAPAEWCTIEDFERACKVNLLGTISVTLTFLPLLRKHGGRLVNMCSVTSNLAYPGITSYVVSKAAVKMFSGCMRRELFKSKVSVHTIEPCGFSTNVTNQQRLWSTLRDGYTRSEAEVQDFYGGNISKYLIFGLHGAEAYVKKTPEDVADFMQHAVLARFPHRRYVVGWDTIAFFRPVIALPEWLADYVLGWPKPFGTKAKELITLRLDADSNETKTSS